MTITTQPATEHTLEVTQVAVLAKMSKREAASLVRYLTDEIAESNSHMINIKINLQNQYGGALANISVGESIFGASAVITDSCIRQKEAN